MIVFKGEWMENKKRSNKLILQKQDLVLIKKSEEVKNANIYGNLYEALLSYSRLSYCQLEKDIVFDEKARMTLLHNFNDLMNHVKKEWYAKTNFEIATEETHCELCGAKNIYVCYIANRINGEELHVGSKCVKNYNDINGADIVLAKLESDKRNLVKETRASDFDSNLGADIDFTKIAKDKLDSFPVLLPYELHTKISSTIIDCNRIRTAYISAGGDLEKEIDKFRIKKCEFENLYDKANVHYTKNKDNPLICTRIVSQWLSDNYQTIITDIQKSNGILKEETLKFIYEPQFIKSKLPVFRKCLNSPDVQLIKINGTTLKFLIQNDRFIQPITFTTPIKTFMKNIGCYCLTQDGYKYTKHNIIPTIEESANNFRNSINYIAGALTQTKYNIIFEERTSQLYWEKKQTAFRNRWSKHNNDIQPVYKKTTIDKIYNILVYILYIDNLSPDQLTKIITSKIELSGHWVTKSDKDKNIKIASEAAGMQKQKEFIPYT